MTDQLRHLLDRASQAELLEVLNHVAHRLTVLDAASAAAPPEQDVLLPTKEIAQVVAMTTGSIDTYVSDGKLVEGTHFFRKGRRRLFSRKAMWAWATTTETTEPEQITAFPNARRRSS